MVNLAFFMKSLNFSFVHLLKDVTLFLTLPTVQNWVTFFSIAQSNISLKSGTFWKSANYADGYWFVYANKKTYYETITQWSNTSRG